jgi:pimeloyl-ACP methyl ester carboxylesterase
MEGEMPVIQDQQEKVVITRQYRIETSHGSLAVEESGQGEIPLVMIHGSSYSRGVFRHQLQSSLTANHRLIAFDLPGSGESSDAPDPEETYTLQGFADAAIELLGKLGVTNAIVFGWSLGGHIGIEMIPLFAGLRGLMITGTPPVGPDEIAQAIKSMPMLGLAFKEKLSPAEVDAYVQGTVGKSAEPFMRDAVARADGRFRKTLFAKFGANPGPTQREIVESSPAPIAVVNGDAEPIVNVDYVETVRYANLWQKHCYRLAGLGHAPFWEGPREFNPLLDRFLADVESGRASAS